jgi:hypothetical protein
LANSVAGLSYLLINAEAGQSNGGLTQQSTLHKKN